MSGHPAGVGLWGIKRRGVAEGYLKIEPGHTAREAYDRSGLRSEYGFNQLTFELVADEAPPAPVEPCQPSPVKSRKPRRRAVGRLVGAERGTMGAR